MVNLFGDWTSDMVVIVISVVIFYILRLFALNEKKSVDKFILGFSIIVFIISGSEVIGTIFGDSYIGPDGSLLISLILFAGSVVYIINEIIELKAQMK